MFNKCGGPVPHLEKLQNEPFLQQPYAPAEPSMPSIPGSGAPAMPYPEEEFAYPSTSSPAGVTQMPGTLNPLTPSNPRPGSGAGNTGGAVAPGSGSSGNPLIPNIIPNAPSFVVPSNPLLPPGYQETLDYDSLQYMNGFLRTQIGRPCEVEFLIGSNGLTSRSGRLIAVGLNYILLQDLQTDDVLTCDFYSIKFVRFYY